MYNIQKSYEIRRLTIRQMRTYHWINSYTSMIAICVTWIGSVRKKLHWTRCPSGSRTPTLHKRFLSALVSSGRARYVGHLGKVVSCYLTAKLHPYHFHSLHLIHSCLPWMLLELYEFPYPHLYSHLDPPWLQHRTSYHDDMKNMPVIAWSEVEYKEWVTSISINSECW